MASGSIENFSYIGVSQEDFGQWSTEQQTQWVKSALPPWLCSLPAVKYVNAEGDKKKLEFVLGPAVPPLRVAVAVAAIVQVNIFMTTWMTTACTGGDASHYPMWLWSLLLPVFVFRLWAELRSLTFLMPKAAAEQGFRVLGFTVSASRWLAWYGAISQASLSDIATDSLFAGMIMRTLECNTILEDMWEKAWQQSFLGKANIPTISFWWLVFLSWCLTMLQMIIPFCRTLRWNDLVLEYDVGETGAGDTIIPGDKVWHDDVAFALADAAGMATLQSLSTSMTHRQVIENNGSPNQVIQLSNQMVERVILSTNLENVVQLNLQSTFYALTIAGANTPGGDRQGQSEVLVSIVLGLLMTLLKFVEAMEFTAIAKDVRAEPKDGDQRKYRHYTKFCRNMLLIKLGCVLGLVNMSYVLVKLIMTKHCEDALWNITGCVDLH